MSAAKLAFSKTDPLAFNVALVAACRRGDDNQVQELLNFANDNGIEVDTAWAQEAATKFSNIIEIINENVKPTTGWNYSREAGRGMTGGIIPGVEY